MADRRANTGQSDYLSGSRRRTGRFERIVGRLAERQDGYVARWQLLAAGVTSRTITVRLSAGILTRVRRGVYAYGTPNLGPRARCWAAVLAGGPGAVLAGAAAGHLWGLREAPLHMIDVITPRRLKDQPGVRFRCGTLPADEITDELGIPATTAIRTAFDLAASLQPWQTERVTNEIELRQLSGDHRGPHLTQQDAVRQGPRHSPKHRQIWPGSAAHEDPTRSSSAGSTATVCRDR